MSVAVVEFRNVFQLDPKHRDARFTFAKLQMDEGNLNGALRNFLLLVEQHPDDAEALLELSEIAIRTNQWEDAERYGRRTAELLPDEPRVEYILLNLDYRLAVLDRDGPRRADIATRAEEIVTANPDVTLLSRLVFDFLIFEGRERDALIHIDRAIETAPLDLSLYRVRLAVLEELGETPEIENQLRQMVDRFPGVLEVRQTLFRWLMSQGDMDAAEQFLRDLANDETAEDRLGNQVSLIQFLRANRGADAAMAELDALIAAGQNPDLFNSLRGGIFFDQGEREEGIAILEGVIAGAEPSEQTRNIKISLAKMQIANGNLVAGRALVEETLSEDPSHVEAAKLKAEFLIDGDKASDAVVLLRTALQNAPEDPTIYSLMARAHERNGNRDLTGEMLARAVEVSNRAPAETIRLAKFLMSRDQEGPAQQALVEALRRARREMSLCLMSSDKSTSKPTSSLRQPRSNRRFGIPPTNAVLRLQTHFAFRSCNARTAAKILSR